MKSSGAVLTIGTFDGVHRGHQKILKEVRRLARAKWLVPMAVTFDIPPRLFFSPSKEPSLLTTVDEKVRLLKEYGMERVEVLKFNRQLSRLSAGDFLQKFVMDKFKARMIVVGYNFAFGRGREGDISFIQKWSRTHSVPSKVVSPLCSGDRPISSGRIRDALRAGRLAEANRFLGHDYRVSGKVVPGQRLGAKIGFPTANLDVSPSKILPLGVFAVKSTPSPLSPPIKGGERRSFKGMCNIGFKPTVSKRRAPRPSVEAHLFGFRGNLYGKLLGIGLHRKLRDEKRFAGLEQLKRQIARDKAAAIKAL